MKKSMLALIVASACVFRFLPAAHAGDGLLGGVRVGPNAARWEIRAGIAAYDSGVFSRQQLDGAVIDAEVLAPSPDFLASIGAPRPYIGTDIAVSHDPIDVVDAGLNWEAYLTRRFYLGFSLGGAIDSRSKVAGASKDLGSRLLFHLQASAGFDLTSHVSAQIYYNHFSNAKLAHPDNGLESIGARLAYRF